MKFTKGSYIGEDIVIELSKAENLELRRALNQCKKEDVAQIQLNRGSGLCHLSWRTRKMTKFEEKLEKLPIKILSILLVTLNIMRPFMLKH